MARSQRDTGSTFEFDQFTTDNTLELLSSPLSRRRFLKTASMAIPSAESVRTDLASKNDMIQSGRKNRVSGDSVSSTDRIHSLPGPGPDAIDVTDRDELRTLDALTADQREGLDAHTQALQQDLETTLDRLERRPNHHVINVQDDLSLIEDTAAELGVDETHALDPAIPVYRLQADSIRLVDGTTIELPPGTYTIPETLRGSVENWTLRGTGESPRDVRLITQGENKRLIEIQDGRNIRIENLTIHNGSDGARAVGLRIDATDGVLIKNVHHTGVSPREGNTGNHEQFNRQENSLNISISQPDGVAITDGFVKRSPTRVSGHAENDPMFAAYSNHRGIWYIRNSVAMHGGGDGASYTSRTRGGVRFSNCVFKNNYAASIRLGGGQSWVRNCTIICDHQQTAEIDLLSPEVTHMSPIVWESGGAYAGTHSRAGGLIENTRVELRSVPAGRTQGCISIDGSNGGVIVRDCHLINETDSPSLTADQPGTSFMNDNRVPGEPHGLYLENLRFTGDGTGPAITISGRRALARGICVSMPNGGAIQGVRFLEGGPQRTGCSFVEAPNRPALYQRLLSLQQGVPAGGQGIGAVSFDISGLQSATNGIRTVIMSTTVLFLVIGFVLVAALVIVGMSGLLTLKQLVS